MPNIEQEAVSCMLTSALLETGAGHWNRNCRCPTGCGRMQEVWCRMLGFAEGEDMLMIAPVGDRGAVEVRRLRAVLGCASSHQGHRK